MEFSVEKVCRTCMNEENEMCSVFSHRNDIIKNETFAEMLMTCASIKVATGDGLPEYICVQCVRCLTIAYNFKQQSEQTDATLREITKNPGIEFIKEEVTVKNFEEILFMVKREDSSVDLEKSRTAVEHEQYIDEEYLDESKDDIILELQETKTEDVIPQESYHCNICGKSFLRHGHFFRHKQQHATENLECYQCQLQFNTYAELRRHKKNHFKNYKCQLCDKEFKSAHGLTYHIKIHAGVKNYQCPYENCERKFTLKQALEKHVSIHSNERNHLCSLCGKTYSTYDALHYHLKTHRGERPHLCTHCGKTFKQSCHLKAHMWIHNGIKPHVCQTCGKCYTSGHQLKKHLKKYCNALISEDAKQLP